jgi:hypothetical protein
MAVDVWDGTWRDLDTGVDPAWGDPESADADLGGYGAATAWRKLPDEPVTTRLEGPWGLPWYDGLEDPYDSTGLTSSPNPTAWSPNEDVGAQPIVGAFEGAFRTRGPIMQWGHEVSGGLFGDQAIGRIMRFPANIPERWDPYGVENPDWKDELSAAEYFNSQPYTTDAAITTSLLQWPNVQGRY